MKLRIKGDSLRLRVTPAEMARLIESGGVEETIHFGPEKDAHLTYALEHGDVRAVTVRYAQTLVAVIVPTGRARAWAGGDDVGIYGSVAAGANRLEIAVEKDWACLDKKDAGDEGAFPNPNKQC